MYVCSFMWCSSSESDIQLLFGFNFSSLQRSAHLWQEREREERPKQKEIETERARKRERSTDRLHCCVRCLICDNFIDPVN